MSMLKVLVTGGAGLIGFHVAKHLALQGQQVTIVDNHFRGKNDAEFHQFCKDFNIVFIPGDLADQRLYHTLPRDFDYIYHLGAINGTDYFYTIPDQILRVNLLSTIFMLDWFATGAAKKFVFASSSETYAGTHKIAAVRHPTPEDVPLSIVDVHNPRWSYAGSKIAGELLCLNYAQQRKLRISVVRYANVYGPRGNKGHVIPDFFEKIVNREDPFVIKGSHNTRTFCFVKDAAIATQKIMETQTTDGHIINLGRSAEEITMHALALLLFEIAGFKPNKTLLEDAPEGSVMRRCPDTTKLKQLTGFEATTSLKDGLAETYNWFLQYNLNPSR